jgi:DNA-binding NarL/FixJ family response regulator
MHVRKAKPSTIRVILASARDDDHEVLGALLEGGPWELKGARSVVETIAALDEVAVPIVLCDQDLELRPWWETMRVLLKARRKASVTILASAGAPELCADVARRGGFDLLLRPFEREQLYATLMCAYAQCRIGWPVLSQRGPVPHGSWVDVDVLPRHDDQEPAQGAVEAMALFQGRR